MTERATDLLIPSAAQPPSDEIATWRALWHERGLRPPEMPNGALRAAIDADGFDWGPGFLDEAAHQRWAMQALTLLDLQVGQRVLDCGSGAGALSTYLSDAGGTCVSIDLSYPLLRLGRRLGTTARAVAGEAGALPCASGAFDRVLSNSVFQYFPDLDYARRALRELLRVCRPGGRVVLMDIYDAAQRDAALAARSQSARIAPRRGSAALSHVYYPRSFFTDALRARPVDVAFAAHTLSGAEYEHAPFRFHVVISLAGEDAWGAAPVP